MIQRLSLSEPNVSRLHPTGAANDHEHPEQWRVSSEQAAPWQRQLTGYRTARYSVRALRIMARPIAIFLQHMKDKAR